MICDGCWHKNNCADYEEKLIHCEYFEPMTEQEWLHTLNTEQLAEFLCEVWGGIDEIINIMSEDGEINKKDAFVRWLKQPHKEKHNG